MAIYGHSTIERMSDALGKMCGTYLDRVAFTMTREEFISACVKPEHVEILESAAQIINWQSKMEARFVFESGGVGARLVLDVGPLVECMLPRYDDYNVIREESEVYQRVVEWVTATGKVARLAYMGRKVLYWLNAECGNPKAMQTMFPATSTLIGAMDTDRFGSRYKDREEANVKKKVHRIAALKTMGDLPSLPPAIRRDIYEMGTLVNVLGMVEAAPKVMLPDRGARLKMESAGLNDDPTFEFLRSKGF